MTWPAPLNGSWFFTIVAVPIAVVTVVVIAVTATIAITLRWLFYLPNVLTMLLLIALIPFLCNVEAGIG
jgi:hypothetical protein